MKVTEKDHRYVANIAEREEGGTPGIVSAIRCGLVFQLKAAVGVPLIHAREQEMLHKALEAWSHNPRIVVHGTPQHGVPRLAIVSFSIIAGHKVRWRLRRAGIRLFMACTSTDIGVLHADSCYITTTSWRC